MKYIWKRAAAWGLCAALTLGLAPAAGAEEAAPQSLTVADWKFEQSYTTGGIGEGTLVIQDQSGNKNHLEIQLYKDSQPTEDATAATWAEYLKFSAESMTGEAGSLIFAGDSTKGAAVGADFLTVESAPINSETFQDGYTLEFIYRLPEDWTAADAWMGLMARQAEDPSTVNGMDEAELGSMSVAVSNCKEIQFTAAPAADDHTMSSAAWSVSMDEGGVWYHIAITSDNHTIRTFVNGCEAFRDYVSDDMVGLFADEADGRFRIGSSWWQEGSQTLDKFLQGSLQQVRVSSGALAREDWLVPNPEEYLGDYGSNDAYALKNQDNYNIVLMPDTQNTVKFRGEVMAKAVQKLIDSADDLNVKGVIHLGDVVENVDETQYATARSAFYKLPEAGIPTLMQLGNHDGGNENGYGGSFSANSKDFVELTGDYLANNSPSGNSSYMLIQAGSYNYLVISLSAKGGSTAWDSKDEDWLTGVLDRYSNYPTIVTSHDIQNCSDTVPSAVKLSKQGEKLWKLVKGYDQVFLLAGGHSHGAGVETLVNDSGKAVYSILTDYQFAYNGGNGFFRYLEFDESADKLYYSSYSPYAASLDVGKKSFFDVNFMTGAGNEGTFDLDFSTRFAGMEWLKPTAPTQGFENGGVLPMELVGRYTSGGFSVDGGVMEIVAYNIANKHAYAVNGQSGMLAIIPMANLGNTEAVSDLTATEFDVAAAVAVMDITFVYGDMTSVTVSPDQRTLAVALQAEGYAAPGRIALFTCNSNGSLTLEKLVETGVQPDMAVFADNNTILTADEGEPREGYAAPAIDPMGSVSIIDVAAGTSETVDFTAFDSDEARQALVDGGIVLKKGSNPSVDLEPEYIAVSGGKAYVSLQEANAIAVLDLETRIFTGIYSIGFEDYGTVAVDVDKGDGTYTPKTYQGLLGIRMPDGINTFTANGKTYLITANEGDSRDWNGYLNENEMGKNKPSPAGNIAENQVSGKVLYFLASDYDGLDSTKDYLFGGRSFTILEVTDNGLKEVYTSGSDFESKTAQYLPDYFNVSNDNAEVDNRSGKKGPEPESVITGTVDGKTYAFVALERTGGIMAYDVTDPENASFVNYINTRVFEDTVLGSVDEDKFVTGGDVAPEGLKFLAAAQSPTGYPLLLTACEVSGTVAVYQAGTEYVNPNPPSVTPPSGGSSGATTTVKNEDGSTTKIVTNKVTGSVTETTTYPDGTKIVVTTPKDGRTSIEVSLPQDKNSVTVTIPTDKKPAPGEVVVIVKPDGTKEIVKTSVATEGGMRLTLTKGAKLEIIDNSKNFSDVASDNWAAGAVQFAASRELFQGTGGNSFSPAGSMTRSMLVTVLARLDGQDTEGGETWYSKAIAWGMEAGITDGTNADASITRESLVVMLHRYAKAEQSDGMALSKFADSGDVSDWAVEAMAWAVANGIINGNGGKLNPSATATRAEVAVMLQRFVLYTTSF